MHFGSDDVVIESGAGGHSHSDLAFITPGQYGRMCLADADGRLNLFADGGVYVAAALCLVHGKDVRHRNALLGLQPSLSKAFSLAAIPIGGSSLVTITLTNPNAMAATLTALRRSRP